MKALSVLAEKTLHLLEIAFSRSGLYFSSGQPSLPALTGHHGIPLAQLRFRAELQAWMSCVRWAEGGDGISP